MTDPRELLDLWRSQADAYERDGASVRGADLLRRVAEELEEFMRRTVDVHEAAALSRYTKAQLRELARHGRVPAFKDGAGWRFVAAELPRKPKRQPSVVDEVAERRRRGRRQDDGPLASG